MAKPAQKINDKKQTKRIEHSDSFVRQPKSLAHSIIIPNHEAKGVLESEISSVNLATLTTSLRTRYYAGCMVIEIQTVDGWMRFITDSIEDMQRHKHGVSEVIRKVRKTEK